MSTLQMRLFSQYIELFTIKAVHGIGIGITSIRIAITKMQIKALDALLKLF